MLTLVARLYDRWFVELRDDKQRQIEIANAVAALPDLPELDDLGHPLSEHMTSHPVQAGATDRLARLTPMLVQAYGSYVTWLSRTNHDEAEESARMRRRKLRAVAQG